jgi:serine/threonine protein kinase
MSLEFVVIAGPDKGRTFTLNVGPDMMLGRSAQAQYQLNDPRTSRNHCAVLVDGAEVSVTCNGGSGGTLVNGNKVSKAKLKPGDVLQVGDTQLRLVIGDTGGLDVAMAQSAGAKTQPPAAAPSRAEQLTSLVGKTVAHFNICMVIGTGRSGIVFHATDTRDKKPVALKVLQPEFATEPEEMERFVRAMKTMMPLKHPNLIQLYGAGKTGPYCWVAMEFIAGENLTQVINRIGVAGMLDWRHAFRAAVHIARALEYVHDESIIHRNVTPTNILLEAGTKRAKLGDLMLAKAMEGVLAKQVTKPGEILGDVAYMSPERTRGTESLDGRTDLYGLGAVVYGLLTGRPPFEGATLVEKISRIRSNEPEKPRKYQMGTPDRFQGVVMKLLAKRPDDRFQTATELIKELEWIGRLVGMTDV